MAVVEEAGSLAGEALNPHAERLLDLARAAAAAAAAAAEEEEADTYGGEGGLHQVPFLRCHQDNGFSTSASGMGPFRGTVQLQQQQHRGLPRGNCTTGRSGDEGFKREIRDLEELLSKLNPMAEEFVPSSLASSGNGGGCLHSDGFSLRNGNNGDNSNHNRQRQKKISIGNGRRRMNTRTSLAQREEVIRRTIYVSDIDHQVTEEQLATLFINCGQVVDCRVCGDPNSVLRFAFIEFTDEEGARTALSLSGTMLGFYPVRVLPSKTAIAPVNPTFLPRSEDEREICARTVYCTNIDKKVTQAELKLFFESICGEVYHLRLLGDYHHSTRIAFVEFVQADSATAALNCNGVILGSLPIRVSPSKTPVHPRVPRQSLRRL